MTRNLSLHRKSLQTMLRIQDFKIQDSSHPEIHKKPFLILIAGDASDRKFFRLVDNNLNALCMQFPKWEGGYGGDPISWIGMHSALTRMNIPIPKILEIDENNSCIWTEDLGDIFLNSLINEEYLDINNPNCQETLKYYEQALDLLLLAQYPIFKIDHPAETRFFDFDKLFYELNFFVVHFLNGFMGLNISEQSHKELFEDLRLLALKLDNCEKVLCHRDYHVRNIMVKDKKIYWIDFQDARMGPHSYDVVSLVRDSYVKITWETRKYFFKHYLNNLNNIRIKNNFSPISESSFNFELILMGLQRNLKAIGSFGYLATKKGKNSYLKYIQYTLTILTSLEAQIHQETDIKHMLPNLYSLINNLFEGEISRKLDKLINKYL